MDPYPPYATPQFSGPPRSARLLTMGIVGIVYGAIGLIVNPLAMLGTFMEVRDTGSSWSSSALMQQVLLLVSFLLATFLIIASIFTIRRGGGFVALMRAWAVLYVIALLAYVVKALLLDWAEMQETIRQTQQNTPGATTSAIEGGFWFGFLVVNLFMLVYPVLVFFLVHDRDRHAGTGVPRRY